MHPEDVPCVDCKEGVLFDLREYFMVSLDVWREAMPEEEETEPSMMLCVGCLEARIKRELVPTDFAKCALNDRNVFYTLGSSDRLRARMGKNSKVWKESHFINYLTE